MNRRKTKEKSLKVYEAEQKIACDILGEMECSLMSSSNTQSIKVDDIVKIIDKYVDMYNLCRDPFSGCLCTHEERAENCLEYQRQIMMERYGHCDGLDD